MALKNEQKLKKEAVTHVWYVARLKVVIYATQRIIIHGGALMINIHI